MHMARDAIFELGDLTFVWDPEKHRTNVEKHGITFEEAATTWLDPLAIETFDEDCPSNEDRWFRIGSSRIEDLAGLGRRMPLTSAALLVGGLGLIGVPGTAGFVSKWYLLLGALEAGLYPVAALLLLSSLIAALYVWRIVEIAWFREAPAGAPSGDPPLHLLAPAWILIGATLYFGVFTRWSAGIVLRS